MGLKLSLVIVALFLLNACGLSPRAEHAVDALQQGVVYAAENDPSAPTGTAVCPNTGNNLKAACYAGMKFECFSGGMVTEVSCVGDGLIQDHSNKKFRVQFSCAGNNVQLVNDVKPGDEYSCAVGTMTVLGF
jgi:hypothetical protein